MFKFMSLMLTFATLLVDLYIYQYYVKPVRMRPIYKMLWFLPLLISVFFVAGLYLRINFRQLFGTIVDFEDHLVIFLLICFVSKFVFAVFSLLNKLMQWLTHSDHRPLTILGIALSIVTASVGIYGYVWGLSRFTVKNVEIVSDRIPAAFDGYRIVQVSDLHLGSWRSSPEEVERVAELVEAQNPDVVMFTGDLINRTFSETKGFESFLERMKGKDGTFAVLGNHDYCTYQRYANDSLRDNDLLRLRNLIDSVGWRLMENENDIIVRGNDTVTVVGVENWGEYPFPKYGDFKKAMRGADTSKFVIFLSHNPRYWHDEVRDSPLFVDLTLSGHTHAMQFKIGNLSPASSRYPEWSGLYEHNGRALYVSEGIGYIVPIRVGAWPELTVLTLKRGSVE